MKDFFCHLFFPQESNNYRAKLLHHKSLLFIVLTFFIGQFFLTFFKLNYSSILGISANVSSQEMLLLINQKRQENGLSVLNLNDQLSQAALLKGKYMFEKNYWAHNSPDGTTPWVFLKNAGYNYTYAGENLARGFTTSQAVVDAWMASQSHKDNILSPNYQDIGFAVLPGNLLGEDTVLVVEMFGGASPQVLARKTNNNLIKTPLVKLEVSSTSNYQTKTIISQALASYVKKDSFIDSVFVSRNITILALLLFIFVFTLDMIIIERKKIIRMVGHNIDHTLFLGLILIFAIIFSRGVIL